MSARTDDMQADAPVRIVALALLLATMLSATNQLGLSTILSVVSADLSVSVPVLGQITTAIFLGSAIVGLFAGPLADQYGKRRVLVMGLAVIAISCAGTSLAPSYGWLLVTRLVSAISGGLLTGTSLAIAAALFSGPERRRVLGAVASGNAAAGIVGVPAMALVASLISWRASYAVLGVAALLMIPVIYRLLPNDRVHDPGSLQLGKVLGAYRPLLAQRSMLVLYASNLARAIGWVGTISYMGAHFGDNLGMSTGTIGVVFMITGVGYLLGTRLSGGRAGDGDPRRLCAISTLVMAVCMAMGIVLPFGSIMSIILLSVGAGASGFGFVVFVTLLSTESHAGKGTTMSLNGTLFSLGTAIGALLGGVFLAVGGYTLLGLGLMLFSIASALLVWQPVRMIADIQESTGAAP